MFNQWRKFIPAASKKGFHVTWWDQPHWRTGIKYRPLQALRYVIRYVVRDDENKGTFTGVKGVRKLRTSQGWNLPLIRFFGNRELVAETNKAISVITGRELRSVWNEWMEWLGKNAEEYGPPDGYVEWKGPPMSLIDPRFGEFLAPAAQGSRINVSEIAWGGVRPDGISELQNAPVVSADEQDYLQPKDRVFGVSKPVASYGDCAPRGPRL